jgi:hypothetical protein
MSLCLRAVLTRRFGLVFHPITDRQGYRSLLVISTTHFVLRGSYRTAYKAKWLSPFG